MITILHSLTSVAAIKWLAAILGFDIFTDEYVIFN